MNFVARCRAETPKKNKKYIKVLGWLGGVCASILAIAATGVVIIPVAIVTAAAVGTALLGSGVVYNAQKVVDEDKL